MGGYGALRNGLYYNDTFSKLAAFSSRVLTAQEKNHDLSQEDKMNLHMQYIVGSKSYSDLEGDLDIYKLAQKENRPELFIACGTEDFIYQDSRELHEFLEEKNIEHIYEEAPGEHKWDFWDIYIEKAIEWMIE